VKGHSVLDAAGEIQVLGLCEYGPSLPAVMTVHGEHRRAADQSPNVGRTRRLIAKTLLKLIECI
jgi:hypothetical protein